MKNLNRATRNGGKKAASAQSANAPKNEPGQTQSADSFVTIRFTGYADGDSLNLAEFQIPKKVYFTIGNIAEKQGVTLGDLMRQIIDEQIARAASPFSAVDFENSMQHTLCVLDLLLAKLLAIYDEQTHRHSPSYNEQTTAELCGYQSLIMDAKKSLKEQCDKAFSFIDAKGGVK